MTQTACLDAPVGPGTGEPHDIALVQAMLAHIERADGASYWSRPVDGSAEDPLADAINRFQEDFGLLDAPGDDIRAMVSPASRTFQYLREAAPRHLAGMRGLAGTTVLYIPPTAGARMLCVLVRQLRMDGSKAGGRFGRHLAALAERVHERHRLLIRFAPFETGRRMQRTRVLFHGLKWVTAAGRLTSSEMPDADLPEPLLFHIAAEALRIGALEPEWLDYAGQRELWLRLDD